MALPEIDPLAPAFTRRFINLASASLGARVIFASDEFFADKQRMLNPEAAVFIPGKYDANGKWMDGWETRRKRSTGHDYAIVQLMRAGVVHGVDIDTSHFTGNYPPAAALEACYSDDPLHPSTEWQVLLPAVGLQGNQHHYHAISDSRAWTHLRLNIFPDGGIARLRVYGQPAVDWSAMAEDALVDLAAAENGGTIVAANNQHFGAASQLLMPGRGVNMGDGWETRRRREPGHDWCIVALAHPGVIQKIEVDTCHFKGNFPDSCALQAAYVADGTPDSIVTQSMFWPVLMDWQKLGMDAQHFFAGKLQPLGKVSHVRFNIQPDGGVSRLRLWGTLA